VTSQRWVSQRAVAWVYDEAPVPTSLIPVLTVIAMRCDEHGRGSYQSIPTIAEKTGKSADQVKKDVRDLVKAGLLVPGDESLVAHLPAWSRPKVYDVPLHVSGPKPSKESRNKQGVNRQGGCTDTPWGTSTPGCMDAPGGGCISTPGGGCTDTPQEKPLNNPLNNPPPPTPSDALEVVDAEILEEGEDSTSSTEDQLQHLIDEVRTLRPNWPCDDVRTQTTAALGLLGGSFEAVAELVRRTAADPTSARPSRITAAGNPHLRAASTALLVARADAYPEPAFTLPLRPDAHAFEAKPGSRSECQHCPFPEPNGRHRVPKPRNTRSEHDGWAAPPVPARPHRPFQNPPIEAYYGEL
jgi:hypothetical protein